MNTADKLASTEGAQTEQGTSSAPEYKGSSTMRLLRSIEGGKNPSTRPQPGAEKTANVALEYARAFKARGWCPLYVPFREKKPRGGAWQHLRLTAAEVESTFVQSCNVGVLLGEVSDWLVDVDLDCAQAIALAPEFLKPTLTFGRASARKAHWLYRSVGAEFTPYTEPTKALGEKAKTIVELRSGPGHQTIFPGSFHKDTGEAIEFEDGGAADSPITEISASDLLLAVKQIAAAARRMRNGVSKEEAIRLSNARDFSILEDGGKARARAAVLTPSQKIVHLYAASPFQAAVDRFNQDNPLDLPRSGTGTCPACGHNDCFGQLNDDTTGKWSCFSASHGETDCGRKTPSGIWAGDALDLEAHENGCDRLTILRRQGYLDGPLALHAAGTPPSPSIASVQGVDVVQATRAVIDEWKQSGSKDPREVITRVRQLQIYDPAEMKLVQDELKAATQIGPRSQGLSLTVRRVISGDTGPHFDLSENGAPLDTLNNVMKALEYEEADLFFDEFSNKICYGEGAEWTDADTAALHVHLQDKVGLQRVQRHTVQQGIHAYATERRRNPVRASLAGLQWDGVRRLPDLFPRGFGATRSEYVETAGVNFIRGMVARVFVPGRKVDCMPILEGLQGIGKSTACRMLAGDKYFGEITRSPTEKDFYIDLQGKMLLEWGELESFNRAETASIKGCVSRQVDRFRDPYAAISTDHPRQCVFIGTTNGDTYLRDETGNRRFWPISCTKVDLQWIGDNREQLLAEAVADIRAGAMWWVMPKEAAEEQEARFQVDPWEDLLKEHLGDRKGILKPREYGQRNQGDLIATIGLLTGPLHIEPDKLKTSDTHRVAKILRRLGFVQRNQHLGEGKVKTRHWVKPEPAGSILESPEHS